MINKILKSTLAFTGSQWRRFSIGDICSFFFALTTSLAAVFFKHWSLSSSVEVNQAEYYCTCQVLMYKRMDQPLTVGLTDIVSDLSDVFQSKIARLANILNMLL